MTTALVTGANGFLGSALIRSLLKNSEATVRCLVRPGSDHAKITALAATYPGRCEIVYGFLNDRRCCDAVVSGVDVVFHLASAKSGAPAEMFLGCSVATTRLLDAIKESGGGIRLLHCSSFSVYGVSGLPRGALVDEETPLESSPPHRDLYAFAKWHQEKLVREYAESFDIPTAILRPGVIYGPGGSAISPRVGLKLFGLFLFLGGSNIVPLTHVDNCADAFVAVAAKAESCSGVYNVVDDDLLTAAQFLKLYRRLVEPMRYLPIPYWLIYLVSAGCEKYHQRSKGQLPDIFTRYKSSNMWRGNRFTNKKLKEIGWRPAISVQQGIRDYFTDIGREQKAREL